MPVRTMDDIRKEQAASGGTGVGGGIAPAANPYSGGGGAAGGNYTTAGGYTPIPDQYSMGGVGPGDVFIDACGETVPVHHNYECSCFFPHCAPGQVKARPNLTRAVPCTGGEPFAVAAPDGHVLPVLYRVRT
jgi:hypothetical protein